MNIKLDFISLCSQTGAALHLCGSLQIKFVCQMKKNDTDRASLLISHLSLSAGEAVVLHAKLNFNHFLFPSASVPFKSA